MLGPRSYLRSNKAEDIADDLTEMAKNLGRKMASKTSFLGRGKREIHNMEETVSQLVMTCLLYRIRLKSKLLTEEKLCLSFLLHFAETKNIAIRKVHGRRLQYQYVRI